MLPIIQLKFYLSRDLDTGHFLLSILLHLSLNSDALLLREVLNSG